jgi:hypothetical protein
VGVADVRGGVRMRAAQSRHKKFKGRESEGVLIRVGQSEFFFQFFSGCQLLFVSDMEGTYLPAADVYTGAGTKQIQISQGFNPNSMVDVSLCCICLSLLYLCVFWRV